MHNLIKSRFGFVQEKTQEVKKIKYFFKRFRARSASSVYLDDMPLAGPYGVGVDVEWDTGERNRR